jgi:hypothetical protein
MILRRTSAHKQYIADSEFWADSELVPLEVASFEKPTETRTFKKGKVDLVKIGGVKVGRAVYEPGWRWSRSLKSQAKTESCDARHFQYHLSGTLHIEMDDGSSKNVKAGEVSSIPPGHDAWVVGKQSVVVVDFQGMLHYAEPAP